MDQRTLYAKAPFCKVRGYIYIYQQLQAHRRRVKKLQIVDRLCMRRYLARGIGVAYYYCRAGQACSACRQQTMRRCSGGASCDGRAAMGHAGVRLQLRRVGHRSFVSFVPLFSSFSGADRVGLDGRWEILVFRDLEVDLLCVVLFPCCSGVSGSPGTEVNSTLTFRKL